MRDVACIHCDVAVLDQVVDAALVAERLAALRLRPLAPSTLALRLLWPFAGLALIALGWWVGNHDSGWGATLAALTAAAFAQAARNEAEGSKIPGEVWLFSRRNAIIGAAPFVLGGWWTALLVTLLLYAAGSLFAAQHLRHRLLRD